MSEREFDDYLRQLSEQLGRKVQRDEIAGELRDHLEEHFDELIASGVPRDEAIRRALDEFGAAPVLADSFAAVGRRQLRRRMVRWSGATMVGLASSIVLLWAMWPEHARVPLASRLSAQTETDATTKAKDAPAGDPEQTLEELLRKPADGDFVETSLHDVVSFLSDQYQIPIEIDQRGLEEAGIGTDTPISLRMKNVPLELVLNRLTREHSLAWTFRDEALEITTPEIADETTMTRVYDVHDLILPTETSGESSRPSQTGDELIEVIEVCFAQGQWERDGGQGLAVVKDGSLIVTQTWRIQRDIVRFLAEARKAAQIANGKLTTRPPGAPPTVSMPDPSAPTEKIHQALRGPTEVDFVDTPLTEVLSFLSDIHKLDFSLDRRALEEQGTAADSPVTMRSTKSSLQSVLNRLTRRHQLNWTILDDSILITTPDKVASYLATRLYLVGDLVANEDRAARAPLVESIVDLIKHNLGRTESSWTDEGGTGSALALSAQATIVISQTEHVHRQVEQLLSDLRASRRRGATKVPAADPNALTLVVYPLQLEIPKHFDLEELEPMIQQLVEPSSWIENPHVYLDHVGNRLVVRQTAAVQRKVRRFLTQELGLNILPLNAGSAQGMGGGMGGGGMMGSGMKGGGGMSSGPGPF